MNKLVKKDFMFLSSRQRLSPFPAYLSIESMCFDMKKYVGERVARGLLFFKRNTSYFFLDKESYDRVAVALFRKIIKNPEILKVLVAKNRILGEKLVIFCKKASKLTEKDISNARLSKLFFEFEKIYRDLYATYALVLIVEKNISDKLLEMIGNKIIDKKEDSFYIFNALTIEPRAMYNMKEKEDLIKLALYIKKNKAWRGGIPTNEATSLLIKKHVKNYFWLTRDYEDKVMEEKDVIANLNKLFNGNILKEYSDLKKAFNQSEKIKKKYFNNKNFSAWEKKLFLAMGNISYLKELRKRYVSEALYYFDSVLMEAGKRMGIDLKRMRLIKIEEIKNSLVNGKKYTSEANERLELSLWYFDGSKTNVWGNSKKIDNLFRNFHQEDLDVKSLEGIPVSPGIARGPAKIVIDLEDCKKVEKGDIIISVQVVPSFFTAISRSAGLVCDGGHGITSHPAILSREAGIPCVIRTKFATKIIKDGDIVEVDAKKGIVKIIKGK